MNVLSMFKAKPVTKPEVIRNKLRLVWDSTMDKAKEIGVAMRQELPSLAPDGEEAIFFTGLFCFVLVYEICLIGIVSGIAGLTDPTLGVAVTIAVVTVGLAFGVFVLTKYVMCVSTRLFLKRQWKGA